MSTRRRFGSINTMRSGRHQASYVGPDSQRYYAPTTYRTKGDADRWLVRQEAEIAAGRWTTDTPLDKSTIARREAEAAAMALAAEVPFEKYSRNYILSHRFNDAQPLAARSQSEYLQYTEREFALFHGRRMSTITPQEIKDWYEVLRKKGKLALLEKSYSYLKTLFNNAIEDEAMPAVQKNPCTVKGGTVIYSRRQKVNRKKRIKEALVSGEQLDAMIDACIERYKAAVVIGAWIGLRSEELRELRRKDVNITRDDEGRAVITFHIKMAVTYVSSKELELIKDNLRTDQEIGEDGYIVGLTKSAAGERTAVLPPHANEYIINHLEKFVGPDEEALLFSAVRNPKHHLAHSTFWRHWSKARQAALREDVTFHGLRHKSATAYAQVGATMMELMERYGHNDVKVAMMYQQVAAERDAELVKLMSADHTAKSSKTPTPAPTLGPAETDEPQVADSGRPSAAMLAAAFAKFLEENGNEF